MKQLIHHKNLPWLTLVAGGIGLLLRLWLQSTSNDKGFFLRGHISGTLLIVLSVLFLLLLWFSTRDLKQAGKYRFNFPASVPGGIAAYIAGAGFAITSITDLLHAEDTLALFAAILGILSAAALVFVGMCRLKGRHPSMLFHSVICAHLMLRLICLYRVWSSDPQLMDYCFQLLALVCAMLAAYHRATFNANFGSRRSYAFFNLASVFFCCLSLTGPENIALYLAMGLWLFTDQCNLTPMPRGKANP